MTAQARAAARRAGELGSGSVPAPAPAGSVHGSCRWCRTSVLWLAHVRTGKVQPINSLPEPGGNIRVVVGAGGPTGWYVVVPRLRWPEFDGQLHIPHRASCENATGRRLMTRREVDPSDLDADADAPRRAAVPCAAACGFPLPEVDLVAGERFHALCDPRYTGRGGPDRRARRGTSG